MEKKRAEFIGADLSTSALTVCCGTNVPGQEDVVSIPMRGAVLWNGQPAHDLSYVPGMLFDALTELKNRGWDFRWRHGKGGLSFSVRQHDMVLLDENDNLLMPALSWQCNAATEETDWLNADSNVVNTIGRIEPRFILAKLIWVMRQSPDIARKIKTVLTTGDWISGCLTGEYRLSTSDGLSNGLLDQMTKQVPKMVLGDDVFSLLPSQIQSGKEIGFVTPTLPQHLTDWAQVVQILQYWPVISSLGDNHAGAVGCGLTDSKTIVISAGTSGTVVRACPSHLRLVGKASCFEYYDDRLLLMMLPECASWFTKFGVWFFDGERVDFGKLDKLAAETPPGILKFWSRDQREELVASNTTRWNCLAGIAQFSIAIELLVRAKVMLEEVAVGAADISNFVLTGGMSKSPFFQEVMSVGLSLLQEKAQVLVSNREGQLASQAATLGAMINAMVGSGAYKDLASASLALCPLKPVAEVDSLRLLPLKKAIAQALGC